MPEISVIIPSKNEPYLQQTVEDIKEHAETDPEILYQEDMGNGQRATMNRMALEAKGKYIMKVDAHCSFGYGFDRILLENIEDDMTIAPLLLPLNAEQWEVSHHNKMSNFVFDTNFIMYHGGEKEENMTETMCMQGSFFMTLKDNYFDWNLCDESLGSWGHQGAEVGIQTWLHGGRCVIVKDTYYGHLFRHKDEEFPYKRNQQDIDATHNEFIKRFKTKDTGWLVEKFDYPLDWPCKQ